MHQLPITNYHAKRPISTQSVQSCTPHASHLALFLCLFSIYLLTYTPHINSSDGLAMFSTAESLVRRGALDIEQIRWMDLQQGTFGLDGLLYSRKGIGLPIGLLPFTWLGLVVPWWGTVGASLLFNALVTALTAVLISAYLSELGYPPRTGLIVALTFGLTTLAWPYAKSLFSDPFSGLLLLSAAYTLLKFRREAGEMRSRGEKVFTPAPLPPRSSALLYPFLAGLFLAWNVAARYAEAVFVPVFGLLLIYDLRFTIYDLRTFNISRLTPHAPRLTLYALPPLLAFAAPLLLTGLALIAFNLSRYGDPFNTGYLPNETFSGVLWQGVLGQLVSPGRGLLLYCPIFVLSLVGLPAFLRRHRAEAVAALAVILIHLLMYGQWFMWHGGYAWGPRFMVPTLPFWAILLAPLVERAFNATRGHEDAIPTPKAGRAGTPGPLGHTPKARRAARGGTRGNEEVETRERGGAKGLSFFRLFASPLRLIFFSLAALGFFAQLLSVAIDFAPFQNSLLETGLPLFDPQTFFDPRYSPFVAAWRFVTPESLDLAWAWQGRVNGWLLAALLANIALTTLNLRMGEWANGRMSEWRMTDQRSPAPLLPRTLSLLQPLALLSTLAAATFLLVHTHTLPPQSLQQAVAALNAGVRPNDAVITNDPEMSMPFAELYKGRAPALGLQSGGPPLPGPTTRRVNEMMAQHRQIWWLPDHRPPEQSAVEQMLMAGGFRARNDSFGEQRLVLFATPADLSAYTHKVESIFGEQIKLLEAAYPPETPAGAVLPIELRWQALAKPTEDYHVFIHVVGSEGQVLAQADGQPVLWTRPTTSWAVGEKIMDRYAVWLPPGTPPGGYQLLIGLYRPAAGPRIPLTSGEDAVKLKVIVRLWR